MTKIVAGIGIVLAALMAAQAVLLVHLKRNSGRLDERLDRLERRLAAVPSGAVFSPPANSPTKPDEEPEAAPPRAEPPLSPEQLDGLIRRRVDQKVSEQMQKIQEQGVQADSGWEGKKRPLAEVSRDLGLAPAAEQQMLAVANEAKRVVFDVFLTPRPDGGNFVDDLIQALMSGKDERAQFLRMFTELIPGTEETYFAAAIRISEDARRQFSFFLTPEQLKAYDQTGVGPLDLQTGFDPFEEYWKAKYSGK